MVKKGKQVLKRVIQVFIITLFAFKNYSLASSIKPFADLGLQMIAGSHASKDEQSVMKRNMAAYGFEINIGLKWKFLQLGGGFDYILWDQLEDPSKVENVNTYGTQKTFFGVAGLTISRFQLIVKIPINSEHELKANDSEGRSVAFSDPENSMNYQLRYRIGESFYIGIQKSETVFTKETRGSSESTLDDNDKVTFSGWGGVFGYTF